MTHPRIALLTLSTILSLSLPALARVHNDSNLDTAKQTTAETRERAGTREQEVDSIPPNPPQAGEAAEEARYAEREAQSPEAQQYRGGDTVVIGATTATIVLAVILLIVIL
jgi:hypothetical protein